MSISVERAGSRRRGGLGPVIWFAWMLVMWIGFFGLLFAGQLGSLWSAITALPVVVQVVGWVAFLPWMLATWVWTGTWAEWMRVALVLGFAIGWIILSIPQAWRSRR